MSVSREFVLTALIVALVPGTGVLYTVSAGLFLGRRTSVFAAVGGTVGIVPHIAAAVLGLSALVHTSAQVFQVLKLAGVAYLLYLAWGMWRSTGALSLQSPTARTGRAIVLRGAMINLLNPKLTIFFFAFLPQFLEPGTSGTAQMVLLGVVFMAVTLAVFVLYGAVAARLRDRVLGSPKVVQRLQRSFAAAFAALGVQLVAQDR